MKARSLELSGKMMWWIIEAVSAAVKDGDEVEKWEKIVKERGAFVFVLEGTISGHGMCDRCNGNGKLGLSRKGLSTWQ